MAKNQITVSRLTQFLTLMASAKAGGQFASITYEVKMRKLNKYPKVVRDDNGNLVPDVNGTTMSRAEMKAHPELAFAFENVTKQGLVSFHFNADYEKAMAKALGIDSYDADDSNRFHLLASVAMMYLSTKNICAIAMPQSSRTLGIFVDGNAASDEQISYIEPYKQPDTNSVVPYITIGLQNVIKMNVNNTEYSVNITDWSLPADLAKKLADRFANAFAAAQ